MTDEGKSITEKWVASKKASYPYAFDKGGKLARRFGVTGLPTAVLIDATGTVVWRGHPGRLGAEQIRPALDGALKTPLFNWPKEAEGAKKALVKGQVAKALELAKKVEGGADIVSSIQGLIDKRMADMDTAFAKQNYYLAMTLAEENVKGLAGLPQATEAAELAKRISDDGELKKLVKGQKKLADIRLEMGSIGKKKDADKLIKSAEKVGKSYKGTVVADQANELVGKLNKLRRSFKR